MTELPRLARRLAAMVADPRWGGGLRREHAAELLGLWPREFDAALWPAYRAGAVDMCGRDWVVAPGRAAGRAMEVEQ